MKFKVDTTEYARWREQRRERADKLLQRALEEAGPEQARWAARYTPPSGKSIEKYNAARENDGKYWVRSREFGREKREWEPGRLKEPANIKKLRKASPALTRKSRLNEIAMRHPGTGVFVFSLGNGGWGYQYPAGNFKQMVENQATRKAQRIVERKLKEYAKFGVW